MDSFDNTKGSLPACIKWIARLEYYISRGIKMSKPLTGNRPLRGKKNKRKVAAVERRHNRMYNWSHRKKSHT